jgi:hypothetical protein
MVGTKVGSSDDDDDNDDDDALNFSSGQLNWIGGGRGEEQSEGMVRVGREGVHLRDSTRETWWMWGKMGWRAHRVKGDGRRIRGECTLLL